ncbi:M24 metallopeptidase, partial [Helicosporidium sp. ATCC 50920]
ADEASFAILREAHVAARFQAECLARGSTRLAYPSVVAGGADACTIHYSRNDKALAEGDLLLVDAGCEAQGYASDVTRTWPVDGIWSPEQRAVYEAVRRTHARCLSMVRPGETLRRIHAASADCLAQELGELGLLSRTLGHGLGSRESYRDFYPHSVGHWLGMDTHDVPSVAHDAPLEPGVVLTIEPGIYVPRAGGRHGAYEGIGVRIEDVVAVTESGHDVLSGSLPVCPDDVADLVRNG